MTGWMKRGVLVLVAGAAVIAAAGCGSSAVSYKAGPGPGSGEIASPAAGSQGGSSSVASPGPAAQSSPATHTASTTHPTPAASPTGYPQYVGSPAPLTVSLSAACLTPGQTETLTLRTKGGYSYSFNTQYADGNNGRNVGGWGYGLAPSTGTVVSSWVISPKAAPGTATVFVAVEAPDGRSNAFRQPTFKVASSC